MKPSAPQYSGFQLMNVAAGCSGPHLDASETSHRFGWSCERGVGAGQSVAAAIVPAVAVMMVTVVMVEIERAFGGFS